MPFKHPSIAPQTFYPRKRQTFSQPPLQSIPNTFTEKSILFQNFFFFQKDFSTQTIFLHLISGLFFHLSILALNWISNSKKNCEKEKSFLWNKFLPSSLFLYCGFIFKKVLFWSTRNTWIVYETWVERAWIIVVRYNNIKFVEVPGFAHWKFLFEEKNMFK